jgi:hypothetical protein
MKFPAKCTDTKIAEFRIVATALELGVSGSKLSEELAEYRI